MAHNKYRFNKNDLFFSFNYTHTLENVYNVPMNNIKHITRSLVDKKETKHFFFLTESLSDLGLKTLIRQTHNKKMCSYKITPLPPSCTQLNP